MPVRMPETITWGDKIPISGNCVLASNEQPNGVTIDFGDWRGRPHPEEMHEKKPLSDGRVEYRFRMEDVYFASRLGPGDYDVTVSVGSCTAGPRKIHIRAGSWREKLAKGLAREICANKLLSDIAEYRRFLAVASIETPASPEAAAATSRRLHDLWNEGFAKHRSIVTDDVQRELDYQDHRSIAERTIVHMAGCDARDAIQDRMQRVLEDILRELMQYERSG